MPLFTFFWSNFFQKGIHSTKIQESQWWMWLTLKKSLKRTIYERGMYMENALALALALCIGIKGWLVLHFWKPEECVRSHLPQSHLLKCPSISKATTWFLQTLENSFQLRFNISSLTTLNMKLIPIMGSCILFLI